MSPSPRHFEALYVHKGSANDLLGKWAAATTAELVELEDTAAARRWLATKMHRGEPPTEMRLRRRTPSVVVVEYEPEESWSLAVLLSQLLEDGLEDCPEVVLIAEGPLWALPVLVTDFPRLTVVPPGGAGRESLIKTLKGVIAAGYSPVRENAS